MALQARALIMPLSEAEKRLDGVAARTTSRHNLPLLPLLAPWISFQKTKQGLAAVDR